jgi:Transposase DDE domain group 1
MTDCTNDQASDQVVFPFAGRRRVTVTCSEDELSNDAGVLLLRQVDERCGGLTSALAEALSEWRNPIFIVHSLHDLVRERVFAIAQGYEDGNDAPADSQ